MASCNRFFGGGESSNDVPAEICNRGTGTYVLLSWEEMINKVGDFVIAQKHTANLIAPEPGFINSLAVQFELASGKCSELFKLSSTHLLGLLCLIKPTAISMVPALFSSGQVTSTTVRGTVLMGPGVVFFLKKYTSAVNISGAICKIAQFRRAKFHLGIVHLALSSIFHSNHIWGRNAVQSIHSNAEEHGDFTIDGNLSADGSGPLSRSSVTHVAYIVSKFDEVKRGLVQEIGFDGILDLPQISKIDRKFTLWLLTKLDLEKKCIIVNDNIVTDVVDFEVARILGIPCGRRQVCPLESADKKSKIDFIQHSIGSREIDTNGLLAAERICP